ncbi:MAG: acyl-CoA dehydrogenase family protein [Pseudomonadota bacterium]
MRFELSEEQLALQNTVERLLEERLDSARLLEVVDGDDGFDPALWHELAAMGVPGLPVPEAHGGVGLGLLDAAVVAEVLGRYGAPGPMPGHWLAAIAIAEGGSEQQKAEWLPRLASGEAVATVALGEGDNRWQPDEWRLAAGETLRGTKHHVLYPERADVIVAGVAGGGLVLVTEPGETVSVQTLPCLDATRRTAHVTFESTPCAPLDMPGARLRDAGLVLLAADAFGGARRALDMAVDYALEREQFGRRIGSFQGLKHQLANLAVEVEPARGLYWYAAHAFDAVPEESARMAAIAKAHITDAFVHAGREATQAHGGIAYTWEYPLHIWVKRAVFDKTYLGSPDVHRQRSAAMAGWAAP